MRILYCVRLFSGLESSLKNGAWCPAGVPTIYRMIEALDNEADALHLVFTCKDGNVDWPEPRDRTVALNGLRAKPLVLAGKAAFPAWLKRLRGPLRELRHIHVIWSLVRKHRPDLVYLDHANIFSAAILSRLAGVRVVLRVMGRRELLTPRFTAWIIRRRYRAPFALVLGTQDGSGADAWLERALSPKVPREVLLNGVDITSPAPDLEGLAALPDNRTIVMFLGRLDPSKRPLEFADAFLRASQAAPGQLCAVFVGSGELSDALRARFSEAGREDEAVFLGAVSHDDVAATLCQADIYVSLNRLGNLSNANLEALSLGCCMVIPKSRPEEEIDVATDGLIPEDAALRIDGADVAESLSRAILRLHRDPAERSARGKAAARAANSFITSWDNRVAQELALLRGLSDEAPSANQKKSETCRDPALP